MRTIEGSGISNPESGISNPESLAGSEVSNPESGISNPESLAGSEVSNPESGISNPESLLGSPKTASGLIGRFLVDGVIVGTLRVVRVERGGLIGGAAEQEGEDGRQDQ